jgi:hypothetical protein
MDVLRAIINKQLVEIKFPSNPQNNNNHNEIHCTVQIN